MKIELKTQTTDANRQSGAAAAKAHPVKKKGIFRKAHWSSECTTSQHIIGKCSKRDLHELLSGLEIGDCILTPEAETAHQLFCLIQFDNYDACFKLTSYGRLTKVVRWA